MAAVFRSAALPIRLIEFSATCATAHIQHLDFLGRPARELPYSTASGPRMCGVADLHFLDLAQPAVDVQQHVVEDVLVGAFGEAEASDGGSSWISLRRADPGFG
ncbi:hypothetical protein [Nocardia suismassiliense]|uniref:hypothetical protein n=1 Tax=Nocardia suismassiliense TaxID=2077092 RepID=UPI00131EE03C|nr:hypothetical protein [Nocardia suismassiliense]